MPWHRALGFRCCCWSGEAPALPSCCEPRGQTSAQTGARLGSLRPLPPLPFRSVSSLSGLLRYCVSPPPLLPTLSRFLPSPLLSLFSSQLLPLLIPSPLETHSPPPQSVAPRGPRTCPESRQRVYIGALLGY